MSVIDDHQMAPLCVSQIEKMRWLPIPSARPIWLKVKSFTCRAIVWDACRSRSVEQISVRIVLYVGLIIIV